MARDHRRLAAIVSFDVAGYSRLMGIDDSGTLVALKAHRRELIDPKIAEHDGRIVKTMGDGLLVEFSSVVDAVRRAVEVQRGMAERNAGVSPDRRLAFRIGINVGDIIIDGDDIFGDGVNVAARLEALADPGGICVSRVVRDQVLDKLSFAFEDLGPQEVKNIARPVEVYRVALEAKEPVPPAKEPVQPTAEPSRSRPRPVWILLIAVVAVGLGVAAWTVKRTLLRPAVVAPYSIQDRRMTFAVLPFQAPDDKEATQVAAAMTEAVMALEEGDLRWAQVASRRSVEQALAQRTSAKDVGTALDVHFLIRGNVTPAPSGYNVELLVVDSATERVIGTKSVAVSAGAPTPRRREDLESALGLLTYRALQAEVQRARTKPVEALDVRDLSFRAYVDWGDRKGQHDEKGAYVAATDLLNRALAISPDDRLALYLTARVNLCDCVDGWSKNVAEQQTIGAAALDKYLRYEPESLSMLNLKSELFALRGRYEESMLITESVLKREPENVEARFDKSYALLKLGRPQEALAMISRSSKAMGGP